jgi:queuine/archaeosine tRNA-ribosyltransferase
VQRYLDIMRGIRQSILEGRFAEYLQSIRGRAEASRM